MFEQVVKDKLIFSLNKETKTASIIGNESISGDIIIPRAINHENQEFIIVSLEENSFKRAQIKSLNFSPDSEIRSFDKKSLEWSKIESLTIPSSVSELKEGWCEGLRRLVKVTIMPNNKFLKMIDDKLIVGKSDSKSDEFDVLIFATRGSESVTIPPNIKQIHSYAFNFCEIESVSIPSNVTRIGEGCFSCCNKLRKVEIPDDSKLEIIGEGAFSSSRIKSIKIPIHVKQIHAAAFYECSFLQSVEIREDSELQTIEKNAFYLTKIESLTIPSNVSELKRGWCSGTAQLKEIKLSPKNKNFKFLDDKIIVGKMDEKSDNFDVIIFAIRDIKSAAIPPDIKQIATYSFSESEVESVEISPNLTHVCKYAFSGCGRLRSFEIPPDSKLHTIEKFAFEGTSIETIFIPPKITNICSGTFALCRHLRIIEISPDSELQTIEKSSLRSSSIGSLVIPPSVSKLEEGWCEGTRQLNQVTIMPGNKNFKNYENDDRIIIGKSDSDSDVFDVLVFVNRNVNSVALPHNINEISPYAFSYSNIESIFIPSSVTQIDRCAFLNCVHLKKIEINQDSKLQTIGERAFLFSDIKSIFLPSQMNNIYGKSFADCYNLQIIEIGENNKGETIRKSHFKDAKIIMFQPKKRNLFESNDENEEIQ